MNEVKNKNEDKNEKVAVKNNSGKKTNKYRNLNQMNKKQNSENDDDLNTDIGNWKILKTFLNSHSKPSIAQIPDLDPRTGGLDYSGGDVTLKCLSVAVSSTKIQKNRNEKFTVYAGK